MFSRVGGGFTLKAADVGADLVGKIEKGIPEDDPRNPAVIADNVVDNVGDCAGMAADLFESYVVTIIAAMLIGASLDAAYVNLPLLICAMGAIATIIGTFTMKLSGKKIMAALYKPVYATALLTVLGIFIVSWNVMLSIAASVGVVLTLLMFWITEHYTSTEHKPVRDIANASKTGAELILFLTRSWVEFKPVAGDNGDSSHCSEFYASFRNWGASGVYGIAIAAVAMLSMTGIVITLTRTPITDNAG